MQIIKLFPNMIIELKKPHPCGRRNFKILRVGSVCRVVCLGCGRDMDIDRLKLEKSIKKTNLPQEQNLSK
ncbi:MAG: DUF951 domain-containing protein [Clostridia bacterium]|nr:DUF951 domain-containing protein [Clostridia bacterium]